MKKILLAMAMVLALGGVLTVPAMAVESKLCNDSKWVAEHPDLAASMGCGDSTKVEDAGAPIIEVILGVLGVAAVVVVILGGIQYATSLGDPGKVKRGHDMILYGVIGLVIALLAFAIVKFVMAAV